MSIAAVAISGETSTPGSIMPGIEVGAENSPPPPPPPPLRPVQSRAHRTERECHDDRHDPAEAGAVVVRRRGIRGIHLLARTSPVKHREGLIIGESADVDDGRRSDEHAGVTAVADELALGLGLLDGAEDLGGCGVPKALHVLLAEGDRRPEAIE